MNNRKSQYDKKGMYNGYDKKNKEREALDYYSTPTEEVTNILNTLNIDFNDKTILEPCAGGGHMLKAIQDYVNDSAGLIATDIKKRTLCDPNLSIETGKEFDFLSDNYPYIDDIDYIIMNPPYAVIEPFVMKSLSIANKGIIMLGRLQFLEGEARYNNIFKLCPPTDVYVYVDRIACFRNGDLSIKPDSVQAYAWFIWNLEEENPKTKIHWIRRSNKKTP